MPFIKKVMDEMCAKNPCTDTQELFEDQKMNGRQKNYLKSDLDSHGDERFSWLAIHEETKRIVGTIEYGIANELIQKNVQEDLTDFPEIGTDRCLPN